jgi:hypothetical protein
MPSHATIYDFMAERFRALGDPTCKLERIIADAEHAGYVDLWEMPRQGIVNAMRARGIVVANGIMSLPEFEGDHFDPVKTDYAEFVTAAKRIIAEAEYPIDTLDLVEATGLATAAAPLATMRHYLRKEGVHYLPGVGYWRHPQFTTKSGRIISRHCRSERTQALLDYFEVSGWPIAGPDAERETGGLVTSRFLARHATTEESARMVQGIGSGLYVPMGQDKRQALPMSHNVAKALLELSPEEIIDDKEHLRLFRLALILERKGFATTKKSRTTRGGVRRQTARVALTEAGRKMIEKIARLARDEF